jgi:hypothetical protein
MSYEEMRSSIWGDDFPASWRCLLAIYVGNIRNKIPDLRQRLLTIQNIGYMWTANALPYVPIKKPNPKKIQVEGFRFVSRRVDI